MTIEGLKEIHLIVFGIVMMGMGVALGMGIQISVQNKRYYKLEEKCVEGIVDVKEAKNKTIEFVCRNGGENK